MWSSSQKTFNEFGKCSACVTLSYNVILFICLTYDNVLNIYCINYTINSKNDMLKWGIDMHLGTDIKEHL